MQRGDLVRCKENKHALGIVLSVEKDQAYLLLGDGLPFVVAPDNWEQVPYYDGATIPANFVELVDTYEAVRRGG